jgi:hypothetical protein
MLHFTNGRKENDKIFQFTSLKKRDLIKIVIIMVIFALLQGGITDIKKGLNGLANNSISSLAMSNQMIIKNH